MSSSLRIQATLRQVRHGASGNRRLVAAVKGERQTKIGGGGLQRGIKRQCLAEGGLGPFGVAAGEHAYLLLSMIMPSSMTSSRRRKVLATRSR